MIAYKFPNASNSIFCNYYVALTCQTCKYFQNVVKAQYNEICNFVWAFVLEWAFVINCLCAWILIYLRLVEISIIPNGNCFPDYILMFGY